MAAPERITETYDTTIIAEPGIPVNHTITLEYLGGATNTPDEVTVVYSDDYTMATSDFIENIEYIESTFLSDGFESGTINSTYWDIKASYGNVGVVTDSPSSGTYCLRIDHGTVGGGIGMYDQDHALLKLPDTTGIIYEISMWVKRWYITAWGGHFCGFGIGGNVSTSELYNISAGVNISTPYIHYTIQIQRTSSSIIHVEILADGVSVYDSDVTYAQATNILFGIQTRHNNVGDNSIYVRIDDVNVIQSVSSTTAIYELTRDDIINSEDPLTFTATATNDLGSDVYESDEIKVFRYAPEASFVVTQSCRYNRFVTTFTDTSTHQPTQWHWEFGDGASSDLQNPTHTYNEGEIYTVTLTASNVLGTDESSIDFLGGYFKYIINKLHCSEPLHTRYDELGTPLFGYISVIGRYASTCMDELGKLLTNRQKVNTVKGSIIYIYNVLHLRIIGRAD